MQAAADPVGAAKSGPDGGKVLPGGRELDTGVGPRPGEPDHGAVARRRGGGTVRGDPEGKARRVGLDHHALADNYADMPRSGRRAVRAREEHQVTGPDLAGRDLRPPGPLLLGGPRDA